MSGNFFGGEFFGGGFFGEITQASPSLSGGAGGVSKWPGRSEFGWEKWRRLEDKKLARQKAAAEKKVDKLSKQVQELRLELSRTRELEEIQALVKKLELLQARLEKAQAVIDQIEMEEVLFIWNLVR